MSVDNTHTSLRPKKIGDKIFIWGGGGGGRGGGARAELDNNAIISASMICLQIPREAHAFCLDRKYIDNMTLWEG